ncbi:MAG: hypothetical protein HY548_02460 [Elusimicrobia bacterium]|nr:hypothetical protein [Elusimicrobiota bacterium]
MNPRERKENIFRGNASGQMIIAAVVATLLVAIFIPVIVQYVRNEARWATKQKKTTAAFHQAEAGIDRGLWKITEADQNWTDAKNGVLIAGYDDDVEYTDLAGGKYTIRFSSGPLTGQVTVRAIGWDTSTNEKRVVEAVYSKSVINAGLQVEGGMQYKPGLEVHWGPIVAFQSIGSPGPGSTYYPRKYSKGQIVGRDTTNDSVNTDGVEYWAYKSDLGDPPEVDLDYYLTQAQNSTVPLTSSSPSGRVEKNTGGNNLAVATPTGSGYFRASQNGNAGLRFEKNGGASNYYLFQSTSAVIYIDNDTAGDITTDLQNGGCFLQVEALICAGSNHNVDYNANKGVVQATIPVNAELEYHHADAQSVWTTNFAVPGAGNCCETISNLGFHGFMYVGGDFTNSSSGVSLLGLVDGIGDFSLNGLTIYYDTSVANNIRLLSGSPQRVSWREIKL